MEYVRSEGSRLARGILACLSPGPWGTQNDSGREGTEGAPGPAQLARLEQPAVIWFHIVQLLQRVPKCSHAGPCSGAHQALCKPQTMPKEAARPCSASSRNPACQRRGLCKDGEGHGSVLWASAPCGWLLCQDGPQCHKLKVVAACS